MQSELILQDLHHEADDLECCNLSLSHKSVLTCKTVFGNSVLFDSDM